MEDLVQEALKLDPHRLLEPRTRPDDNFRMDNWVALRVLDIKTISVQLMNVIIATKAYPFVVSFDGINEGVIFAEGNTMDELLEITGSLDDGTKPPFYFQGYALPENKDLTGERPAYHGKFFRK